MKRISALQNKMISSFDRKLTWMCLSGLLILIGLVIFSPNRLIVDEIYLYKNILYAHTVTPITFINTYTQQTPGPLYEFVHYLTNTAVKGIVFIRLDNLFLLLCCMAVIRAIMKKNRVEHATLLSLLYICLPLTWSNAGTALTEASALLCLLLACLFLSDELNGKRTNMFMLVLAGLLLSLAPTSRSTYLVATPALLCAMYMTKQISNLRLWLVVLLSLLLPAWLFGMWHGLVPPAQAYTTFSGLSWSHLMAGIVYSGFCLFILFPNAIRIVRLYRLSFIALTIVFFIALYRFHIHLLPFIQAVPPALFANPIAKYILLILYALSSSLFVIATFISIKKEKNGAYIFLLFTMLFLIVSNIKIGPYFSSNYVFQFAPFMIILFRQYFAQNRLQLVVNIIGILLGIMWVLRLYGVPHLL